MLKHYENKMAKKKKCKFKDLQKRIYRLSPDLKMAFLNSERASYFESEFDGQKFQSNLIEGK